VGKLDDGRPDPYGLDKVLPKRLNAFLVVYTCGSASFCAFKAGAYKKLKG